MESKGPDKKTKILQLLEEIRKELKEIQEKLFEIRNKIKNLISSEQKRLLKFKISEMKKQKGL